MNNGIYNEKLLVDYINNYNFSEYNNNIKSFLSFLFKDEELNNNSKFSAEKCTGSIKPDIYICYNSNKKYISIKKGSGNSVHQENIENFFPIVEYKMGEEYLNYLKLFHYGDGTIDDTGLKRYNANTCKKIYSKEIKKLNEKFNSWENLVYFLDRFLFVGNKSELIVDALYYGDLDSGLWASREEIINFVKANSFENNNVHFGPLTYQVWGRDENRTALHPKRRYVIQIKWGNLKNNLKYIRSENHFE